jgi:RNA polymerase sigma-70 factor (ECF subfamily)
MTAPQPDTDLLLWRAGEGDPAARDELLRRHRPRLRQLVALRLDRRLAARLDPSDVVQESLAEAARKLPVYLRLRPLPFYPWLRRLTLERVARLYREHVRAGKRSVLREEVPLGALSDESTLELIDRVRRSGSSAGSRLRREELRAYLRAALDRLGEADREILVLRHVEQLDTRETAAVLGVSESAVKMRHLRALDRPRALLASDPAGEGGP